MASPPSARNPAPPPAKAPTPSSKTASEEVELGTLQNGHAGSSLPLEEDIMQCARIGALSHIQDMYVSGKYDASYQDAESITPLHWAAINNQYAVCKWLIEQGVDVNLKGGESNATAAMWAAQRCHFYVVNLLMQNGADPLLTDGQGYNILHLATIDGNALLLILLLHQNIPVDVPDPQGHTSLMWAGYKGWPACVDLLLRWGASVNARDDNGYTPLHWALVKGSKPCLDKIIEYGADRFAETNEGKTPAICAEEMNAVGPWHRALAEHGYGPDGNPKSLPLNLHAYLRDRSKMSKFFFIYPFMILFTVLYTLSHLTIFIGIPISFVISFAMQWIAQQLANKGPPDFHTIHKTPFLAGVFAGTLFWVGVNYLFFILPGTFTTNPILNILFALFFASSAYFYTTAMLEDPGWVPKLASRNQQRAAIEELFSLWKFDEDNFCVQCMIRKPLRSKHCRRCGRCVAKHDHHCPWINNCVGNNNIRHFFIYIVSLELGIILYIRLALSYLDGLPPPIDTTCNILTPALCSIVLRDPWTFALGIWSTLQLIWVTMLMVVQTVQISKNQTTFENMKRHSFDDQHGHSHAGHSHGPNRASHLPTLPNDPSRPRPSTPRRPDGCMARWKKLLGLDAFLVTASDGLASGNEPRNRGNPFTRGLIGNCRDFWCDPAPIFGRRNNGEGFLGGEVVDYGHLYEAPLRSRRRAGGMLYQRVEAEEAEEEV